MLAAVAVGALAVAGWLFLAGDGDDDRERTGAPVPRDREQAEGVLDLPDEEEPTDSRRRGEGGRSRLDDRPEPEDGGDAEAAERLPRIAVNLEGVRIGLGAASAPVPGDSKRRVPIGDLRLRCGASVAPRLASREAAVLDALTRLLDRAGARVVRIDRPPACVDARARRLDATRLGVVVGATATDPLVAPGRSVAAAGDPASATLARELAAAEVGTLATGAALAEARRRATSAGALDLPGNGAVAWVEFDAALGAAKVDELARALLEGLAATAARADVNPR